MKSWEELVNPNDEAREKFFAFLMKRPCTHKQAEEYLSRMKLPFSLMNEAEDMGLIDDLGYSRLFVDGHLKWGNAKIAHELDMRGVSRSDINEALDDAEDEAEDEEPSPEKVSVGSSKGAGTR